MNSGSGDNARIVGCFAEDLSLLMEVVRLLICAKPLNDIIKMTITAIVLPIIIM